MSTKWYRSRMNQAAIIGGVFVLISTVAASCISRRGQASGVTTVEMRTIDAGAERVLSRLKLTPRQALIDSLGFDGLRATGVVFSDSLGVALEKPEDQGWTSGELGELAGISSLDIPLEGHWFDQRLAATGVDTAAHRLTFFGVRQDRPTLVTLSARSKINGIALGTNPMEDVAILERTVQVMGYRAEERQSLAPQQVLREHLIALGDSLIAERLPITRALYSGVFVTRLQEHHFPLRPVLMPGATHDVLSYGFGRLSLGNKWPSMVFDPSAGTSIFSEALWLEDVEVNGISAEDLVINRVGLGLRIGKDVFYAVLQYLSTDSEWLLDDLQQILKSVRVRTPAARDE